MEHLLVSEKDKLNALSLYDVQPIKEHAIACGYAEGQVELDQKLGESPDTTMPLRRRDMKSHSGIGIPR